MGFIRREWTPAAADEWTREDWIVIVLSALTYVGLAVGVALSVLLMRTGFVVLGVSVFLTVLLHWIIDPKLRTISEDYENKQKRYLETLERIERWEEDQ